MDQNIKNRLVGIVVVFALAVIFLPMILDGSGVRKDDFDIVVPPQPEVRTDADFDSRIIELNSRVDAVPELEQRFVDEVSSENQVDRSASVDEPAQKPVAETVAKPKPKPKPKPSEPAPKSGGDSFVLQVGSFQDRGKALAQRDKLRKSNIAAVFIEQFNVDDKPSYRVRLGPFINKEQTRVAQNKIKAKHDIDGIIMKYER
jgi:DedD protein